MEVSNNHTEASFDNTFICTFKVTGDYYKLVRYYINVSGTGTPQVVVEQPGGVLNDQKLDNAWRYNTNITDNVSRSELWKHGGYVTYKLNLYDYDWLSWGESGPCCSYQSWYFVFFLPFKKGEKITKNDYSFYYVPTAFWDYGENRLGKDNGFIKQSENFGANLGQQQDKIIKPEFYYGAQYATNNYNDDNVSFSNFPYGG